MSWKTVPEREKKTHTNQKHQTSRIETAHLTGPSLFVRITRERQKLELNQLAVMNDRFFADSGIAPERAILIANSARRSVGGAAINRSAGMETSDKESRALRLQGLDFQNGGTREIVQVVPSPFARMSCGGPSLPPRSLDGAGTGTEEFTLTFVPIRQALLMGYAEISLMSFPVIPQEINGPPARSFSLICSTFLCA
jgi:hypothetical protein